MKIRVLVALLVILSAVILLEATEEKSKKTAPKAAPKPSSKGGLVIKASAPIKVFAQYQCTGTSKTLASTDSIYFPDLQNKQGDKSVISGIAIKKVATQYDIILTVAKVNYSSLIYQSVNHCYDIRGSYYSQNNAKYIGISCAFSINSDFFSSISYSGK